MKKFLLVAMGETFRYRFGGNDRGRGNLESYDLQIRASKSHLELLDKIYESCECDIFYHFYNMNSKFDSDLVELYSSSSNQYKVDGHFTDGLIGEINFYNKTYSLLEQKDLTNYESILFVRSDFFLKPYFSTIYNYTDPKILFAHVNEICRGYHINHFNEPSVNYMLLHIPNNFFDKLLSGKIIDYHGSYSHCLRNGIPKENLWFMIDTYHSSNSEIIWNPIFHQVGRNESKEWLDMGYRVDCKSMQPYNIKNENIYSNLHNNDFYN